MSRDDKKPRRTYSKRVTLVNTALAWAAIGVAMWSGEAMTTIVVPVMVVLIASLLGIYQGIGHADLRTLTARDQPQDTEPTP